MISFPSTFTEILLILVKVTDARFVAAFAPTPEGTLIPANPKQQVSSIAVAKFPMRVKLLYWCQLEIECGDVEKSVIIEMEFQSPEGHITDTAPIIRDYTVPSRASGFVFQRVEFAVTLDDFLLPHAGTYKMVLGVASQTVKVTPLEAVLRSQ